MLDKFSYDCDEFTIVDELPELGEDISLTLGNGYGKYEDVDSIEHLGDVTFHLYRICTVDKDGGEMDEYYLACEE